MKVVASVIVKNELGRYVSPCLAHLFDFCDLICVVDDGSTDGTYEWLDTLAALDGRLVVQRIEPEDGFFAGHEGRRRQKLLDFTLEQKPDWVLAIDADEFINDGQALRDYAAHSRRIGLLSMEEVWKAELLGLNIRIDGGWRPHNVPIFWQPSLAGSRGRSLRIANRALACGREPEAISRMYQRARATNVTIYHFGWANPATRRPRYERYVTADGGKFHANAHLESIMWPDMDVELTGRLWPAALAPYRDDILRVARADPQLV